MISDNAMHLKIPCWLIFGDDEGDVYVMKKKLISKIRSQYVNNCDDVDIIAMDSSEICNDPVLLQYSLTTGSLFHTGKLIVINNCKDEISQIINTSLSLVHNRNNLVLCAGVLKKNGKLRQLLEKNQDVGVLHCYTRDVETITKEITIILKRNNISYETSVPQVLANNIINDGAIIENEINKILLYFGSNRTRHLTLRLLSSIIACNKGSELDLLCIAVITGAVQDLVNMLETLYSFQNNYIMVIRFLQYFLARVISVQMSNIDVEQATNNLKPPVFGKQKMNFINAVERSNLYNNIMLLELCIDIECNLKKLDISNPLTLLSQSLLDFMLNSNNKIKSS